MRPRIEQELALLQKHYPGVVHKQVDAEDWFLLASYRFPPGWELQRASIETAPVVFKISAGHPTSPPYGFSTPADLTFKGAAPVNTTVFSAPFPGNWILFSWSPSDWQPTEDVFRGSNLFAWARSFAFRLAEGV